MIRIFIFAALCLIPVTASAQRITVEQRFEAVPVIRPYQYRVGYDLRHEALVEAIAQRVVERLQAGDVQAIEASNPNASKVQAIVNRSCLVCHQGEDNHGIDLSDVSKLDNEQARKVSAQVFAGAMPKNANPLPDQDVAVFVEWLLER